MALADWGGKEKRDSATKTTQRGKKKKRVASYLWENRALLHCQTGESTRHFGNTVKGDIEKKDVQRR